MVFFLWSLWLLFDVIIAVLINRTTGIFNSIRK